jgi:Holliday junction DNA helicase RuvB
MKEGQILFLDELHALIQPAREHLLTVLEDRQVVINIGSDTKRELMTVTLPEFTIIGATTRLGALPETVRDRFHHQLRLELYDDTSMAKVLEWTAAKCGMVIDKPALPGLVEACHGTARHAVRLMRACNDTILSSSSSEDVPSLRITSSIVTQTLKRLGFVRGYTAEEVKMLVALNSSPNKRLGLSALAAFLDEDQGTVEDIYEPWLLQKGLVSREPNGRKLTVTGETFLKEIGR